MAEPKALTGNDAAARAFRQIDPDVVAAYPITPQTELMHAFAEDVAQGRVGTEFVRVESEHSAQSAVLGASLAGARCCTATSSAGLALMWEVLYVASSCRCPILMVVVNRALSAPINIHCDHSDSMGARDSGWIQLYSENVQEAYDNVVQGLRIAEDLEVRLPVMVCMDGFILSHTVEPLELLPDREVRSFVGAYEPEHSLLDVDDPWTFGPLALPDAYYEFKARQMDAMDRALEAVPRVGASFGKVSGRDYGLLEPYRCEDAEAILVGLGSAMGTVKEAVDSLREEGVAAGALKVRTFRPFPAAVLSEALDTGAEVGVLDRAVSFGLGGPLFHEIRSACSIPLPPGTSFIYGLGGRDLPVERVEGCFSLLLERKKQARSWTEVRRVGLAE